MIRELSEREAAETRRAMESGRNFCFLDSSLREGNQGRFSIVASDPVETVSGNLWRDGDLLEKALARYELGRAPDVPFPLGAAIGYFTYEGDFWFGFFPTLLVTDHQFGKTCLVGPAFRGDGPAGRRAEAGGETLGALQSNFTRTEFMEAVSRAKEHIAAGDIYQVNLSQRLSAAWSGAPEALYRRLREVSPAPYSAYLDDGQRRVLSSSMELFLRISGRHARTRPIKGTRPRFDDPLRDEQSAYELIRSEKDMAELVMITDLERNDLGRVCEYGSVRVTDLVRLEKYAQVFHLVSTVEGLLRPEVPHLRAVREMFPGGSITGAPKKRAMEIIRDLEKGPRGVYTGAVGYFGFNGETCLNIAIRTMIVEGGVVSFGVGAGITAGSDPAAEYDETLDKARGMEAALTATAPHPLSAPSAPGRR